MFGPQVEITSATSTGDRYLSERLRRDLERDLVVVVGPRQAGKTTLALGLPGAERGRLDWDDAADRERILRRDLPPGDLWVLDEIHQYRGWRDWLETARGEGARREGRRGGGRQRILITASARLDADRSPRGASKRALRFLRLFPLSVRELDLTSGEELEELLRLGGFPEPFYGGSEARAREWSRGYRDHLIRHDVVSATRVQDLGNLELLVLRLPELVGWPLSLNGLREGLGVNHKTVANWVAILERLYALFRLAPFGHPKVRAIKQAPKHYHFDWCVVPDRAARFENLVAVHLLKWVAYRQDTEGLDLELRYFRDLDGREVDFVVTQGGEPILLVEPKRSDRPVDRSLRYLKRRFPRAAAWQVTLDGRKDLETPEGIRVAPALRLLSELV